MLLIASKQRVQPACQIIKNERIGAIVSTKNWRLLQRAINALRKFASGQLAIKGEFFTFGRFDCFKVSEKHAREPKYREDKSAFGWQDYHVYHTISLLE